MFDFERTPSQVAKQAAEQIIESFARYRTDFLDHTRRARRCFEARDWNAAWDLASERFELYGDALDALEAQLRRSVPESMDRRLIWAAMKALYSHHIAERDDWELAETYYNSVTRRVFSTVGVDPYIEFVDSDFESPPRHSSERQSWLYAGGPEPEALAARLLQHVELSLEWEDLDRDIARVGARIASWLGARGLDRRPDAGELLWPLFYRGKGAYLVGRLHLGERFQPLVIALRTDSQGLYVDAVLLDRQEVVALFDVTRSHFLVDTARPYDVARHLQSTLPGMPRSDLYVQLGEPKQAKTELFRELLSALRFSSGRFTHAPGIPGTVMVVFTLPQLDAVLKVIRDRFPATKPFDAAHVQERYAWVSRHNRAGRLVDSQAFEHLELPRSRFEPALLEELQTSCGRSVQVQEERVVISLAYLQRRITPLDLYLRYADPEDARAAALDYGSAIADLAKCNIFAGDLLTKNFGLTRHQRVAFYDYDEILPLTELRFRELPQPRSFEEEMSAQVHFDVRPEDVFPEEFRRFLGMRRPLAQAFTKARGFLFDPTWWRGVQHVLAAGRRLELSPYPDHRRFPRDL